jgi:hypothetical protein
MTNSNGAISCASNYDYPLTIRYLGFIERQLQSNDIDTVFLSERVSELSEVVVESRQKRMLHILAYIREYSSLASYTDTITMFREKMADFMLPDNENNKNKGWRYPRNLNSRSYYHFTNYTGLDSVSDRCSHHFSWSDWIELAPTISLPIGISSKTNASDTIYGEYSPTEVWVKNGDRLSINIDVLADTTSRKWVPNLSSFFRNEDVDFEQFKLRLNYNNATSNSISPLDLVSYSFNIDSRGRSHDILNFNRYDQPFFVTTYSEVYILDKEFITMKEAKKWEKRLFDSSQIEILEPDNAPELQPNVLALIDRVNNINADQVRLSIAPDKRLMSRNVRRGNFDIAHRALDLLKGLVGISSYRAKKNFERNWNEMKKKQMSKNKDKSQL